VTKTGRAERIMERERAERQRVGETVKAEPESDTMHV
jgi:hypothetical protein